MDKKVEILKKLFSGPQHFRFTASEGFSLCSYRSKIITLYFKFGSAGDTLFVETLSTSVLVPEEITALTNALELKFKYFDIDAYVLSGLARYDVRVREGSWVYATHNAAAHYVILFYELDCQWIKD
jgi:hypothetical protein